MKKYFSSVNAHRDHAFFLYDSEEERFQLLTKYFGEGLANNELCIYVSNVTAEGLTPRFAEAGLDIVAALASGALRIFTIDPSYLPDGHFATDYMLHNVQSFIDDAKSLGYSGLRTAGEMSWMPEQQNAGATKDFSHEGGIDYPVESGDRLAGLCLYPMREDFSEALEGTGRTHASLIYDDTIHENPHYSPQTA